MRYTDDFLVDLSVVRNVGCTAAVIYGILQNISLEEADEKGWFAITQKDISELCNISLPSVQNNMKLLERKQLIKTFRDKSWKGNYYRVLRPRFEE